jgi:hypothetical protein
MRNKKARAYRRAKREQSQQDDLNRVLDRLGQATLEHMRQYLDNVGTLPEPMRLSFVAPLVAQAMDTIEMEREEWRRRLLEPDELLPVALAMVLTGACRACRKDLPEDRPARFGLCDTCAQEKWDAVRARVYADQAMPSELREHIGDVTVEAVAEAYGGMLPIRGNRFDELLRRLEIRTLIGEHLGLADEESAQIEGEWETLSPAGRQARQRVLRAVKEVLEKAPPPWRQGWSTEDLFAAVQRRLGGAQTAASILELAAGGWGWRERMRPVLGDVAEGADLSVPDFLAQPEALQQLLFVMSTDTFTIDSDGYPVVRHI